MKRDAAHAWVLVWAVEHSEGDSVATTSRDRLNNTLAYQIRALFSSYGLRAHLSSHTSSRSD